MCKCARCAFLLLIFADGVRHSFLLLAHNGKTRLCILVAGIVAAPATAFLSLCTVDNRENPGLSPLGGGGQLHGEEGISMEAELETIELLLLGGVYLQVCGGLGQEGGPASFVASLILPI